MSTPVVLPSDRSFGLTFVVVFLLVTTWALWTGRLMIAALFAAFAALVLIVTMVNAAALHPLNRAWMKLGAMLHAVVSPVILGAMFFLMIAPIGIAMRIAGRDALRRLHAPEIRTYWIERTPPGPPPDSLTRQF